MTDDVLALERENPDATARVGIIRAPAPELRICRVAIEDENSRRRYIVRVYPVRFFQSPTRKADDQLRRALHGLAHESFGSSRTLRFVERWLREHELKRPDRVTKVIENVSDLVQDLEHSVWSDQPHDAHIRYLFRRQPKPDLPLAPKVYRPSFVPAGATESERCQKERNLYQDFKVMSASLRSGRETEVELYFLQQHYGMPTRLLDWTNNPLAALYFACSGDWSYDGEIFLMDALRAASVG